MRAEDLHGCFLGADPSGTEGRPGISPEERKRMLESHLNVGCEKAISYLPIKTIKKVLGLTVQEYVSMIEGAGHEAMVVSNEECCIMSGAVYAYSRKDLAEILKKSEPLLLQHGWPTSPADFIRNLAAEWLDKENTIFPVIQKAFGER